MADLAEGEWLDRGDSVIYESEWVSLVITDVVMPDGRQVDHHVARMPRPAAGAVLVGDGAVLMLYRHRFITNTWGWEIPAGGVDPGEAPADAAIREAREESGWEPHTVSPLCSFHPANGILDQVFHIFVSDDATHRGEPHDRNEAARIEWVPIAEVRRLLSTGEIKDGLTFGAIAYAFAMGTLDRPGGRRSDAPL
ncbi:MAG: NUDIX hydrolase [Ilumatobacteraceae bacterium]